MLQKGKLFVFIALSCITISGFLLQSCEEDILYSTEYYEFLDVDLTVDNYSAEQLTILEEAKSRINKYVTIRNGKFEISVKSGKEIDISEELYNHFLSMMKYSNSMITENEFVIDGDKLVLNTPSSYPVRLKSGSLEYAFGSNGWQVQVDLMWYGADITLDDSYVQCAFGGLALGGLMLPEPLVSKIIAAIGIVGSTAYNASGANGATVHIRPWGNYVSFNY